MVGNIPEKGKQPLAYMTQQQNPVRVNIYEGRKYIP